jgi:hypothetical protein
LTDGNSQKKWAPQKEVPIFSLSVSPTNPASKQQYCAAQSRILHSIHRNDFHASYSLLGLVHLENDGAGKAQFGRFFQAFLAALHGTKRGLSLYFPLPFCFDSSVCKLITSTYEQTRLE